MGNNNISKKHTGVMSELHLWVSVNLVTAGRQTVRQADQNLLTVVGRRGTDRKTPGYSTQSQRMTDEMAGRQTSRQTDKQADR